MENRLKRLEAVQEAVQKSVAFLCPRTILPIFYKLCIKQLAALCMRLIFMSPFMMTSNNRCALSIASTSLMSFALHKKFFLLPAWNVTHSIGEFTSSTVFYD